MGTGIFNTSLKEVTQSDLKDLEFAVLKTLPPAVCQNAYHFLEWSEQFICAYDSVNHQATCQGDKEIWNNINFTETFKNVLFLRLFQ